MFGSGAAGLDGKVDTGVPFKPFNGLGPDELKERFILMVRSFVNNRYIPMWMKDIRHEDESNGNNLPDVDIIRKVMNSKKG